MLLDGSPNGRGERGGLLNEGALSQLVTQGIDFTACIENERMDERTKQINAIEGTAVLLGWRARI